jgi:MFS family permease
LTRKEEQILLVADAIVNFALGILLLIFPGNLLQFLGAPIPSETVYARILGAVLLGIGMALLLERLDDRKRLGGLGIGGAILINVCGAGALVFWLLFGRMDIPLRGYIILWIIALIVISISVIEFLATRRNP